MKDVRKVMRVKIVMSEGEKFFCHWDVDPSKDLVLQGCRKLSEQPDVTI